MRAGSIRARETPRRMSPDELKRRFPTLTKHFSPTDCEVLLEALVARRREQGERLTELV